MSRRRKAGLWSNPLQKTLTKIASKFARKSLNAGLKASRKATAKVVKHAISQALEHAVARPARQAAAKAGPPPTGSGRWSPGLAIGSGGPRKYYLYQPSKVERGERLPLLVMLHGCTQDASAFATSTRMNAVAERERFFVLYPEQDRLANSQGCWNWFETQNGRAFGEVSTVLAAIDQVCALHPIARDQIALAGLSAGASMAALIASRHPLRFKAVVMHSGVPPGAAHGTLSALGAMRGRRAHLPPSTADLLTPASAAALLPGDAWPPLLVIQGRSDRVVDASNGRAAAEYWAAHTHAHATEPRPLKRGQRYGTVITDFKHRAKTTVTLCEVDMLGHAWSGGNARHPFGDAKGPDASRMVWAFVRRMLARRT